MHSHQPVVVSKKIHHVPLQLNGLHDWKMYLASKRLVSTVTGYAYLPWNMTIRIVVSAVPKDRTGKLHTLAVRGPHASIHPRGCINLSVKSRTM